eukprot:TRINITY_DN7950_c4_g1_i1.p1 TRINITY_DN7950_c4_g1~~TRINITY_DN7950_c4_g1_i1.p1  ORF type:complete len:237 (-),score=50.61 TRINITY_DN7950_c4_g1_i1:103-813(-)
MSLPRLDGSPQVACKVQPREANAKGWFRRVAPRALELLATLEDGVESVLQRWTFVPQFMILTSGGAPVEEKQICASLSSDLPKTVVNVWTGGHPVEVTLEKQVEDSRLGNVSMDLKDDEAQAGKMVELTWNGARVFHGFLDLHLRIVSPVTKQTGVWRIRLEGKAGVAGPIAEPCPSSWSFFTLILWYLGPLALCALYMSRGSRKAIVVEPSAAHSEFFSQSMAGPTSASPFYVVE